MVSGGIVRNLVWLSGTLLMIDVVMGVPVPARAEKDIVLMPVSMPATRFVQVPVAINSPPFYYPQYATAQRNPSEQQIRGPFDFIGQWIQQTPWLPIQINVPDIFQNIGNGISQATNNVQQLSQTVGTGVSQFTQNVGSGFNQFSQNVGNGFNQWMQQVGQRVPILGNLVGVGNRVPTVANNGQQQVLMMVPVEYPGGQELVLDEALEVFP